MKMKLGSSKVVSALALLALLSALLAGGAILERIARARKELIETRTARAELENRSAEIRRAEVFLEGAKGKTEAIERYFVSESEIVSFIEKLETAAGESGVELEVAAASVLPGQDTSPVFELHASGEFAGLFRYLLLLENFPHLLSVEKADFRKSSPWEMQVTVKLVSYSSR